MGVELLNANVVNVLAVGVGDVPLAVDIQEGVVDLDVVVPDDEVDFCNLAVCTENPKEVDEASGAKMKNITIFLMLIIITIFMLLLILILIFLF